MSATPAFGKHEREALFAPVLANNPIGVQVLVQTREHLIRHGSPESRCRPRDPPHALVRHGANVARMH